MAAVAVRTYGLFIDGHWVERDENLPVRNKYTGEVIGYVARATRDDVERAVTAAQRAYRENPLPPYRRYQILKRASELIRERKPELARTIAAEAGKPLKDALAEVDRCTQTLEISAEEAKRIHGEQVPIEAAPGAENRLAFTLRVPVGVVAAISPFNFPLNLAAHKVGPSLAAGNAVVLKPATATPLSAVHLVQALADAGLPPGYLNLVTGAGGEVGEWLLADPRIAAYTFTGSAAVGERIKAASGLRRVVLELGNNSATIVCADADLDLAAARCARGAFANAGQICLSVQRIYVQRPVYEAFLEKLVAETRKLKVGDPLDPETDVGPMISEAEAERAEAWIREAVEQGARVLCGGRRQGAVLEPTVLVDVRPDMKVVCQEAFAPLVTVAPFEDVDEAIAMVNDSFYGLQAGIYTRDLQTAMKAARRIEVGGVMVNEIPNWRVDLMPYGGVKGSGIGREGPRYAIEHLTDLRLVVFNL
ncbi:aldehyde dehydrogenase family protein [Thermaerobacter sp. PB12/4term]|uniref:aldehyde dehydrogenase family protein n=1 Tax=Thermaerobacter sp. PB12/4term TaxID=2293838 RepID=UPI000E328B6A|nr:aldehyde dehydrogenase family protein [Thermaerobacter sp. PB12/4term]QIA27641.1 aldehyde dehydrogenase family protein [Thermaerobacter sp. PB12/4term]